MRYYDVINKVYGRKSVVVYWKTSYPVTLLCTGCFLERYAGLDTLLPYELLLLLLLLLVPVAGYGSTAAIMMGLGVPIQMGGAQGIGTGLPQGMGGAQGMQGMGVAQSGYPGMPYEPVNSMRG